MVQYGKQHGKIKTMKKLLIFILLFVSLNAISQSKITVNLGSGNATSFSTQTYTTGATVTVADGSDWLIVNPATVKSTLTITLPANPTDREDVTISFGGTIASGNDVVTVLTVAANSGQTLDQNFAPTYFQSGESITYKYNLSTLKWYAK